MSSLTYITLSITDHDLIGSQPLVSLLSRRYGSLYMQRINANTQLIIDHQSISKKSIGSLSINFTIDLYYLMMLYNIKVSYRNMEVSMDKLMFPMLCVICLMSEQTNGLLCQVCGTEPSFRSLTHNQ